MFTIGQTVISRQTGAELVVTQRHTLSGQYEVSDGHGNREWVEGSTLRAKYEAAVMQGTKEGALERVRAAHQQYKQDHTRASFRAVMQAQREAQEAGATSAEILAVQK